MAVTQMARTHRLTTVATALATALGAVALLVLGAAHAHAATTTLCNSQTAAVAGGTYIVQNNEWNSSASECVSTDGNADFTVANSAISNATNGAPGAYPSIYQGCHWGSCSSGGLTSSPVQVSALTPGKVTTSWSTTQPGSGAYDVAYDIWFNQTPTTTGQPNGTELMVWLNHAGGVQPFGSQVATNVSIGGHTYNVWYGTQSSWDTVSYVMTSGTTSVSNLDVGTLAQDMVSRGYTSSSWYLIDVESRLRAVAGRGRAGHQLLLGERQRRQPVAVAQPDPDHLAEPVPEPVTHRHRHGRLLGQLLGDQQLARRLPGPGRGQEHRRGRAQWLEPGLDVPRQPEDQQPVERPPHPVRGGGHGGQRLLRRQHRGGRLGHGRLHRHLLGEQHGPRQPHLQLAEVITGS